MMSGLKKIAVIGSGNWGSAIARLVGENVKKHPDIFNQAVKMWVYEELVDGKKLTEIINTSHENVVYLPGIKLPENVLAVPDIVETANDADFMIIVIPHQFIKQSCSPLKGKLKPNVQAISLVKGFAVIPTGGIRLISEVIKEILGDIEVSIMMGANIAHEVADEKFCETTIGTRSKDKDVQQAYIKMLSTPNFRVSMVSDSTTVEICGALKNIVACAAGFVDGLKCGDNTKAAVIRIGLMEMIEYTKEFYPDCDISESTFLESCGIGDLITTCYGGRNRKISEAFARQTDKTMRELEVEMLNGQKLQGPETAAEVNFMLKNKNKEDRFPLFTAVHKICTKESKVEEIIDCLRNHPQHDHFHS